MNLLHISAILRKISQALFLAAALCGLSMNAAASERQYKIEAAYLYSFFNYITWPNYDTPQSMDKPLVCVYGNDPILPYLDYIRTKMASERALTIRSVDEGDTTAGCNIFFIRHRMSSQLVNNLARDTLVVSKPDDPLDRGGMIELSEDGEHIAIRINQSLLERKGFQVSSRLLEIARGVR